MAARVATVRLSSLVYGPSGVEADDPAELYHEASKVYPSMAGRQARGVRLLEAHEGLQRSAWRSVKRHPHRPSLPLPPPAFPPLPFGEVLESRRSERALGQGDVPFGELSSLLHAAYGASRRPSLEGPLLRTVPSGGALYPLEVYAAVRKVGELEPGLYHYDPLEHALEELRAEDVSDELERAMVFPELIGGCAVLFVVAAMFWRTRLKYGLRGYRFALLEAGHLTQNLLLACAALRLPAVPVGGFFDGRMDDLLGLDGVNESTLYAVCVGAGR